MNTWQKIVAGIKMTFKFYCQYPLHGAIQIALFSLLILTFILYPAGASLLFAVLALSQIHKNSTIRISNKFVEENIEWIEKQFPNP